jgi:hypothetical protein
MDAIVAGAVPVNRCDAIRAWRLSRGTLFGMAAILSPRATPADRFICIDGFGGHTRLVREAPLSAVVFSLIGALLLVAALVLGILGSFGFLAVASVGMFFLAAALISRAVSSSAVRPAAVLALAGFALILFGTTATPLFYLGWGVVAGSVALAILAARHARPTAK